MYGSGRITFWCPIRSERKNARFVASCLACQGVASLAEDETDLLLFPPLRATWSLRGQSTQLMLSGRNARRVVFGAMNLVTGHRLFLVRERQYAKDFQAFLHEVR